MTAKAKTTTKKRREMITRGMVMAMTMTARSTQQDRRRPKRSLGWTQMTTSRRKIWQRQSPEVMLKTGLLGEHPSRLVLVLVLSIVTTKVSEMDKAQRLRWFDLATNLKHKAANTFLELLKLPKEQPPRDEEMGPVISASGKLACRHFVRGFCSMGKNCTFSHEAGLTAPPSKNPVVMTQLQEDMKVMAASQKNNPARPVCRHFARGFCQIGASCTFRHPVQVVPPAQTPTMWPSLQQQQLHQQQQSQLQHLPMQVPPTPIRPPTVVVPHVASASPSQGPPRNITARTVSKPCVHFAAGNCPWGSKCHFLHVVSAVQKT
mmetsp:Transcript_30827/g.66350  ORF Transcript_30827/g.66350 Transcript_30827/m.66350 type:complete len:319 (+) Transcript_30827:252-1208(+)